MTERDRGNAAEWRGMLLGTSSWHRWHRRGRGLFGALPSPPRCIICAAPFKGPFTPVLRFLGRSPHPRNPRYCGLCMNVLLSGRGGAEVELTSLFADVRGSTPLAEQLGPTGTHTLMDRFYTEGTEILMRSGALIERFMGDQIVGYFVPGYAGPSHARAAVDAALKLLRATGNASGVAPWVPIGVGVHSGNAFVGTVGRADGMVDLTAIGEDVNVAARLASAAGAGEIVLSEGTYLAAGPGGDAERRDLTLKGVSGVVHVRVLRA
jgi:adenylate cyclase